MRRKMLDETAENTSERAVGIFYVRMDGTMYGWIGFLYENTFRCEICVYGGDLSSILDQIDDRT